MLADSLPDGSDIPPRGMIRFPAPGDARVANSAIKIELFDLDRSNAAQPEDERPTPAIYQQITKRRNVFELPFEEANFEITRCLRGTPWLTDGFPDAIHAWEIMLSHLMTRSYRRNNLTYLRPCVANIRADAHIRPLVSHLPCRDELQFFIFYPGLSRHEEVSAHQKIERDIRTWAEVMGLKNQIGAPIFADPGPHS
jgi:hypothetical protein